MQDELPCVMCGRMLTEAIPGSFKNFQPYYGGEVQIIFGYGSTRFDDYIGSTKFRGLICDDCGSEYVDRMEKSGTDMDGNPLPPSEARQKKQKKTDNVNHPSHYTAHPSGVECIVITEHMGFCLGNAMKYIWRADEKWDAIEDLRKARWYLDREIERRTAVNKEANSDG